MTVSITVNSVADAPVATFISPNDDQTATEDGAVENGQLTSTDNDPGDTHDYTLDGAAVTFTLASQPAVRAQGRLSPAGSHAEWALYGVFEAGSQGQGTFMVWRYRQ